LSGPAWKARPRSAAESASSSPASARNGSAGIAGQGAADEQVEARYGQAFRAGVNLARAPLPVAPARPGAGVEENGHDREVERRPRHRRRVRPGRAFHGCRPAVDPADGEVPPARVEGDVEGGVSLARGRGDGVGAGREAVEVDGEVGEPSGEGLVEEVLRPGAHGGGGEEGVGACGRLAFAAAVLRSAYGHDASFIDRGPPPPPSRLAPSAAFVRTIRRSPLPSSACAGMRSSEDIGGRKAPVKPAPASSRTGCGAGRGGG
jgi:hypothetical protein